MILMFSLRIVGVIALASCSLPAFGAQRTIVVTDDMGNAVRDFFITIEGEDGVEIVARTRAKGNTFETSNIKDENANIVVRIEPRKEDEDKYETQDLNVVVSSTMRIQIRSKIRLFAPQRLTQTIERYGRVYRREWLRDTPFTALDGRVWIIREYTPWSEVGVAVLNFPVVGWGMAPVMVSGQPGQCGCTSGGFLPMPRIETVE